MSGVSLSGDASELFSCMDISWVRRTNEISLHKYNKPVSPDKDTSWTGSCFM